MRYPPSVYLCTVHPEDVYYICVSYIFMGGGEEGEGGEVGGLLNACMRGERLAGVAMPRLEPVHGDVLMII